MRYLLDLDGERADCVVIAEIAQAHEGSLGMAHAYVDAVAGSGAHAVKFQTHLAAEESTAAEPWRVRFSSQDETRFDYWRRMEFTEDQWLELRQHAHQKNLLFISSPFSIRAVELMQRVGVSAWKVASGEVGNLPMLRRIASLPQPVLVSSGMSPMSELDRAVEVFRSNRSPVAVLQCTSEYPCPPEKVGLNMIPVLRERFGCPVGLSDHTGTIFAGLAAAAIGIDVLEVHVTLSREMFGPDVPASITTNELRQLVEGVSFIERMRANPVDKDGIAALLMPLRQMFTKSVVADRRVKAGTVLSEEDLTTKKPGTGLPPERMSDLIGRRVRQTLEVDEQLTEDKLEPAT